MQHIVFILILSAKSALSYYPAIDQSVFENALDSELCDQQLQEIISDPQLLFTFLDPGIRIPKALTTIQWGIDHGNYFQCLEINEKLTNSTVEGKYCSIKVQFSSKLLNIMKVSGDLRASEILYKLFRYDSNNISEYQQYIEPKLAMTVAICLPKSCSTTQVFEYLSNLTPLNLEELMISENYCRLPNDKPWIPLDYFTVALFAAFGILNVVSTSYDLYIKNNQKSVNKLYTSFSIYTNTRRLVTYNSSPNTIECLDGIRVFAMAWVILGHRFNMTFERSVLNPLDIPKWIESFSSTWVTLAPISSVDTFFLLSGLLLVYTTAGKLTNIKLLKNIHWFYLHRVLRLFPMMAIAILLHASIINHVVDGPNWTKMSKMIESCRIYWWYTLLYIQIYIHPFFEGKEVCLPQSWYLSIDMQLHILSSVIMYWVLTSKKAAWISLIGVLLVTLIASTTYIFLKNFHSASIVIFGENFRDYYNNYYTNTLTRASPFIIGMIYGYTLHTMVGRNILNRTRKLLLWVAVIVLLTSVVYIHCSTKVFDGVNQIYANFVNSFVRSVWAVAVGIMILACHSGFGGPVNWFLSLKLWKIPSRLSYAMYMLHICIIRTVNATDTGPIYFSMDRMFISFLSDFVLIFVIAFVATITIDAPFSTLIKMAMAGGAKKSDLDQIATKIQQESLRTRL